VQQGAYNLELAAVPNAAATDLYAGTINIYKCTLSGGTTCSQGDWINLTHVYGCNPLGAPAHVHPDQHGLSFLVAGGKAVGYFAHDGGISRTLDGFTGLHTGSCTGTNQFDSLSESLGSMTEFVSFSVHPTNVDTLLGGTQDNGSPKTATATTSSTWQNALSGDGGFNAINPNNANEWFASVPFTQIGKCELGTGCNNNSFLLEVDSSTLGGDVGAFYTPYILDPQNTGEMLVGTCRVWRVSTSGTFPLQLSNDFDNLGTGVCTGREFIQVTALDAGGQKNGSNSKVVYAVTDGTGPLAVDPNTGTHRGGEVWATTNAGAALMTDVTHGINTNHYAISSVAIDRSDPTGKTAYVGIMGFHTSHVFKTTDAGTSWTDWSGGPGVTIPDAPVQALLVDSLSGKIYAGTDAGAFVSSTSAAGWTEVGPAPGPGVSGFLPNAPVTAIRIFDDKAGTRKLRVSTYGRGIWEFNLATPAPDYQINISDTPQTVLQNQTVIFNGTLTALGTYNSAVTLSCGAGAPGACTFTPSGPIIPTNAGVHFTVQMSSGNALQNYTFNIHGTDGTLTHDFSVTLNVTDFSVGVPNPATVTAQQGGISTPTQYTLSSLGPFNGTVNLSCSGPAVASCSFSPTQVINLNPANPNENVTTTVTALANAALGNSTVTISALTAGEAAKTTTFTLNVVPPDFAWAINGSNSATVLSGQTGTYNFTATPSGGAFASDVAFTCPNLPAQTTCTFNPPSITASGSGAQPVPVQLTITTTGPNPPVGANRRASNRKPWLPLTLPVAGLLLAGIARRKVGGRYAAIGLCLTLAMTFISCGGGGSAPPPPPPPQITVTVGPGTPTSVYPNNTNWPLQTAQFNATVTGTSNTAVTWSVSGGAANGTIDSNGLYSAPNVAPGLPASVTITATSQANSAKSGSSHETLNPATIPGTYNNITVTATDSQVALSQTVTLVVQ
jgi:hypothetical protein